MNSMHLSGGKLCAVLVLFTCSLDAREFPRFMRGDFNCDGCVNRLDGEQLLGWLFERDDRVPLCCEKAADADGSGRIEISDTVFLFSFFRGVGPVPPAPGAFECGVEPEHLATDLRCENYDPSVCGRNCEVGPFLRGDCNGDAEVEGVTDAVFLLSANFIGGVEIPCRAACDASGDGDIGGTTDAIYILTFAFLGTAPPVPPFPRCGPSARLQDRGTYCEKPLRKSCPDRIEPAPDAR